MTRKKYFSSIDEALKQLEKEVKQGKHPELKRLDKWKMV